MTKKLYKYFSEIQYLNDFVENGKIKFGNLSCYINCEDDKSRQDTLEGTNLYKPLGDLEITNLTQNKTFYLNKTFDSYLKNPENYWVFCTSMILNKDLWTKFNAKACVEILNIDRFRKSIKNKIPKQYSKLLKRKIKYYNIENPPETRYADVIENIFSKTITFSDEKEFRFCFSNSQNNIDEINHHITNQLTDNIERALKNRSNIQHDPMIITIGNLSNITKIHYSCD